MKTENARHGETASTIGQMKQPATQSDQPSLCDAGPARQRSRRPTPGSMKRLPATYGLRIPAELLARDLLGRYLVRIWANQPEAAERRSVLKITETEAYLGRPDRASHGFGGRRTARTETLYLPGGHWYVYFIYGMYWCINLIAGDVDNGEAVLIRSGTAVCGEACMRARRLTAQARRGKGKKQGKKNGRSTSRRSSKSGGAAIDLAGGPGKLCQALAIDRSFNGLRCNGPLLYLTVGEPVTDDSHIIRSPRVGIDYAREAIDWPLRFRIASEAGLSQR